MNTRFTLPIAAALALHATLLFGFRKSPHARTVKDPVSTLIDTVFVLPPDTPDIPEKSPDVSRDGSPDVSRPELEDPGHPLKPLDFPISVMPPLPSKVHIDGPIDTRPPGVLNGDPNGIRIDSVLPSGMLDNPPNTRVQVSPDYPYPARSSGLTGEVWVQFVVDTSGRVHDPVVVRSTDRIFDEATVRAVLKWRFEPGKRGGRAVSFRMVAPVVFSLSGE